MSQRRRIAVAVVMLMTATIEGRVATSAADRSRTDVSSLSASDRARFDRVVAITSRRYDEWLGESDAERLVAPLTQYVWSSPASMGLESDVAFELARRRFARLPHDGVMSAFVDGVAWYLQSRVVPEVFDLAHHQPGHHAVELGLFGDHVHWSVPPVVVSERARDDRAAPAIAHAAAAVATLENIVGWPALAAALRLVASEGPPLRDRDEVSGVLERALGIPLDWFFAALDPAFHVDFRLASVEVRPADCGEAHCYRTTITVARDGDAFLPDAAPAMAGVLAIRIGFDGESASTLWWTGQEPTRSFVVESAAPPRDVTVDPANAVRIDDNRLNQRWRADRTFPARPIRSLAAWLVWLQDATLSYGGLV